MQSIFRALRGAICFRSFIQLLVLCAVGSVIEGRPRTLNKCGRRAPSRARIIGGTTTKPGEYPWMVSIHLQDRITKRFVHFCGGSILNERYIVTAAHCIKQHSVPSRYLIYTGLYEISKKSIEPAKMYEISELVVHKDYNYSDYKNDIALLRTKEPIKIEGTSGYVNGICLPHSNEDPSGWAFVSGWGRTKEGGKTSGTLRVVKVPLVSRALCRQTYEKPYNYYDSGFTILDSQICAGIVGKDSCQFDSGGPLTQRNKKGIFTLIGIVSFGIGCANQHFPGVYTKVAYFMDWLEENMN